MTNQDELKTENIRIIREAMDRKRIIQFSYYGTRITHRFAPHEIKSSSAGLYVAGTYYDDSAKRSPRNYTIAKMSDIRITSQTFQPPKTFNPRKSDRNKQVVARVKTADEKEMEKLSIFDFMPLTRQSR